MIRAMICTEVALGEIDFEDETFRVSEDLDPAGMKASLQAIGLINPVVLLENQCASRYAIVCGFRRLRGLRRLGIDQASARCLQTAEHNTLGVFLQAVWDNLSHRRLCPLEVARILFTLAHQCGVEKGDLVARFLPLFGLSPHTNVLQAYLDLHRLHADLRRLVNAGHLTLASAERLARTTPEDQAGSARLLSKIRLSASLQREVLDLADDLAALTRSKLGEILNQPGILALADDARLSPFQKGEQIHAFLYRRRNPRISQVRETFRAEKAGLNLPGTVRLSPDPFFESPRLRVEFDVDSAQAFRETVGALERAGRTAALDRLFGIF
jgi:hypothetical protein